MKKEFKIDIYQKDKILNLLFNRIKNPFVSYLVIILLFIIIPILAAILISYSEDSFYINGAKNYGLFEDPAAWTTVIILGSIICLAKKFRKDMNSFFEKLSDNLKPEYVKNKFGKIVREKEEFIQGIGTGTSDIPTRKIWPNKYKTVFYGIFLVYAFLNGFLYNIPIFRTGNIWHSIDYPLGFIWVLFINFIIVGLIMSSICWSMVGSLISIHDTLNVLYRDKAFRVKPLYPRKERKILEAIGDVTLDIYYILLIPLLLASIYLFFMSPVWFLFLFLYIYLVGVLIIFAFPLFTTYSTLRKVRDDELKKIGQSHLTLYEEVMENIVKGKSQNILKQLENMKEYENLYQNVKRMPIWPFEMAIISKFISTFLIPVIILALQFILK